MASLLFSARPFLSILGFQRQSCRAEQISIKATNLEPNFLRTPLIFRFKNAIGLQATQRSIAVFASKTNPSNGNSLEEKSDGVRSGDGSTAPGPPFLTILAGFLVLLLLVWIFGSIVMWLISLIVNVPPSK